LRSISRFRPFVLSRQKTGVRTICSLLIALLMPCCQAVTASASVPPPAPAADPRQPDTYLARARSLYRGGDVEGAIATLQSALKVSPRFVRAHHLLGSI